MAAMNTPVPEHGPWRAQLRCLLFTLVAAIPIILALPHFFRWLGARPGMIPPEPLLEHLPARDVSLPLFALLYALIVLALLVLVRHPERLVRGLQAYLLLLLLRMATMALVTLEPPPGLVPLHDPVIQHFYPGNEPFTKDLFFSGHVATLCLLAFAVPRSRLRGLLWGCAVLVAAAVLVQHIHWTIDVLAAPLFAWIAWRGGGLMMGLCLRRRPV